MIRNQKTEGFDRRKSLVSRGFSCSQDVQSGGPRPASPVGAEAGRGLPYGDRPTASLLDQMRSVGRGRLTSATPPVGVINLVKMRAVIDWIPKDQGGRSRPPSGVGTPPYSTIVRFRDTQEPWPTPVVWSLVVEKDEAQSEPCRWVADVHYLVDDAPHESLRPWREFDLFEGNKCVAHGKFLDLPARRGGGIAVVPSAAEESATSSRSGSSTRSS